MSISDGQERILIPISGRQERILEVTVVSCNDLKGTVWISRQDPYVCIEYVKDRFLTRICTSGGKNPVFQQKFIYTLIDGCWLLNFSVWNSNTIKYDDFIGSGKVHLQKVLSTGIDDSTWPILSKSGRHSGELRLIMHYANANLQKPSENLTQSAPPCSIRLDLPQLPMYSAPAPVAAPYAPLASAPPFPPVSPYLASPRYSSHPCNPAPYPPELYRAASAFPPQLYEASSAYPPQPYPPVPQGSLSAYPPEPHIAPSAYPPQLYPSPVQGLPYYPPRLSHYDPPAPPSQGSDTLVHDRDIVTGLPMLSAA